MQGQIYLSLLLTSEMQGFIFAKSTGRMLTITPKNLFKLDKSQRIANILNCAVMRIHLPTLSLSIPPHIQKYCKRDSTQAKTLHIVPSVININEQSLFSLGQLITRVHSPIVIVPETKGWPTYFNSPKIGTLIMWLSRFKVAQTWKKFFCWFNLTNN